MNKQGELRFEHQKPPDVYGQEKKHSHLLELKDEDGGLLGRAYFEYHNDPFPVYFFDEIRIAVGKRGRGFGREMIKKLNEFLESKSAAGLLIDAIGEENPAHGMYERHGWVPVARYFGMLSYNLPKNLDNSRMEKAIYEISESSYRKIYKKAGGGPQR